MGTASMPVPMMPAANSAKANSPAIGRKASAASAELWSYPLEQHTLTTAAVAGGLVFATDTAKNLHCLDAVTGKAYWTHPCGGLFWASPYVADGKVYAGTRLLHAFAPGAAP